MKIQKFLLKKYKYLPHFFNFTSSSRLRGFSLWSDEIWQTCPLVSGVEKWDKHSVMPHPTKIGFDWG